MKQEIDRQQPRVTSDRRIEVIWPDGASSHFHFVWLRQQLFNPATGRADQAHDAAMRLPDDPASLSVDHCDIDQGQLRVRWANDGAETCHDLGWLRDNAYDREQRLARKARLVTWTGEEGAQLPWHDWSTVLEDDAALWALFVAVRDRGVARLRGASPEPDMIGALARRFGPIRVTDFGAISDIMSRPSDDAGRFANIGAGGFVRLAPHTDEGWRYAPPGISFHLCLEQVPGQGGASQLTDGLLAAQRLRRNDPQAFDFLTRVPFRFAAARNPEERYFATGRLIVTDIDGEIVGVRFSDRTLGVQDLPEDQIEPAYQALRAFAQELYSEDLAYVRSLAPGEVHVFDNHRVLHARAAFDPQSGARRLQSCAVEREEFHNHLRRLAEKLGHMADANMILPNGALG